MTLKKTIVAERKAREQKLEQTTGVGWETYQGVGNTHMVLQLQMVTVTVWFISSAFLAETVQS